METQYLEMLRDVYDNGVLTEDRTGVGTRSVFGRQLVCDLREEFPLLTTKKMFFRGAVVELLWFLSGNNDVNWLQERGVNFWNSWGRTDDNTIGPGYGVQFRHIHSVVPVQPRIYEETQLTASPEKRTVFGVGYYGDKDRKDPYYKLLVTTWREMLRRCYNPKSDNYKSYGAKGVHVESSWHEFAQFQKDAKKLPGWELKLEFPNLYSLDKDVLWASNRYGKETCCWASHREQSFNTSTNRYFRATNQATGNVEVFPSVGEIHRKHGLNMSATHRALNKKLHKHGGWINYEYIQAAEGYVLRYREIDQVRQVIASIKHNPTSRRHVISLWNPHELDRMQLPPCHGTVIQFNVEAGFLDCLMYQRSGDIFLGVPVNIASYALFTHMIAHVCGLKARFFIHVFGNLHMYENHKQQVETQLGRVPLSAPQLNITGEVFGIDDFSYESFKLCNYNPHPAIPAPVAV